MDSKREKTAISGTKRVSALFRCLNNLTDNRISIISQTKLRTGTIKNSKTRRVKPESILLNPKSKSYLPPIKKIKGNWVNKITAHLKIFSFSSHDIGLNA